MAASLARTALLPTYRCLSRINVSPARFMSFSRCLEARWFTKEHEWVNIEGQKGTVGISNYAQEKLGEIVYVEMPEVGATVESDDVVGCLESVKAASDVMSPCGGTVSEINEELKSDPSLINSSPLDKGWLYKLDLAEDVKTDELMDAEAYDEFCQNH
ncbi:glycine cleavage system h protein [Plakobranchus ocellatus]|uniref:Glycine cleavage system H protein n=1 Tax=Plakobranchus ocellatus TaxID=259542 RepID=A0AAV4DST0_9GAST|nr:glycine cleavage system h protein [Plakobranchus ocellatus]